MEALELYKEENRKMEEHKYACQTAEKQVERRTGESFSVTVLTRFRCEVKKKKELPVSLSCLGVLGFIK